MYSVYDEMVSPESSDDRLLNKLVNIHGDTPEFKIVLKKSRFILQHFHRAVEYEITGFIDKNQDVLSKNLRLKLQESELDVVKECLQS
jgi:myosin heavy subunit